MAGLVPSKLLFKLAMHSYESAVENVEKVEISKYCFRQLPGDLEYTQPAYQLQDTAEVFASN